jgi:hypothetical protein
MEGVNSNMIYLIHCKNFCKYHNIPQPNTTIKKKIFLYCQAQLDMSVDHIFLVGFLASINFNALYLTQRHRHSAEKLRILGLLLSSSN